MNKLYSKVSIFSLRSLALANFKMGKDEFLSNAELYLRSTAEAFEKAEEEIEKAFQ